MGKKTRVKKASKKRAKRKVRAQNVPFTFKNAAGIEYEVLYTKPNSHHYGDADGTCSPPDEENPRIHINPYLTKQSELNTVVHEFAHAFFWDKSEKEVYRFANAVSKFLYNRCGWRKTESKRNTVYKGK